MDKHDNTCSTCVHYIKWETMKGGSCRRFPPCILLPGNHELVAHYPKVRESTPACGEYEVSDD